MISKLIKRILSSLPIVARTIAKAVVKVGLVFAPFAVAALAVLVVIMVILKITGFESEAYNIFRGVTRMFKLGFAGARDGMKGDWKQTLEQIKAENAQIKNEAKIEAETTRQAMELMKTKDVPYAKTAAWVTRNVPLETMLYLYKKLGGE